jgi:hypothetical protein
MTRIQPITATRGLEFPEARVQFGHVLPKFRAPSI